MLIELYTRYLYIDTYTPEKMDVRKRNFLSSIGTIGVYVSFRGCVYYFLGGGEGKSCGLVENACWIFLWRS